MQLLVCRTPSLQSSPAQTAPASRWETTTHRRFQEILPSLRRRSPLQTPPRDREAGVQPRFRNSPCPRGPLWRQLLTGFVRAWQFQLRGLPVSPAKFVPERRDRFPAFRESETYRPVTRGKRWPASLPTATAFVVH